MDIETYEKQKENIRMFEKITSEMNLIEVELNKIDALDLESLRLTDTSSKQCFIMDSELASSLVDYIKLILQERYNTLDKERDSI